jgi:purine-binding chemotaxis protein CheW
MSRNLALEAPSTPIAAEESSMLVTMRVDRQLFGIPVRDVRDVLKGYKVARIPLAPPEVSGSINLRGRIVTVIDVCKRLGLGAPKEAGAHMFVVVEHHGQYYSLMVNGVGEVLTIPASEIEKPPANLAANWRSVATGIHRLADELLVIIDIESLLTF